MKTKIFTEKNLKEIIETFEEGKVIAFPTETVYGLGALISKKKAIRKIYQLKKRDKKKGFIIHIAKIEDSFLVAKNIPKEFFILANYFFPGPLTIILKKRKNISSLISIKDTIAIRMPAHGLTLKILSFLKEPIVGTSANFTNQKPATDKEGVLKNFSSKIAAIIDAGPSFLKVPSTIISLVDEIKILRKGIITQRQIERVLNKKINI